MEVRLDGRVALITGGSLGLGLAMARRFAEAGASVGITARQPGPLEAARAQVSAAGAGNRVAAVPADVSDAAACAAVHARITGELGPVDILVNNAGTSQRGPFLEIDDELWQHDLDLKLFAAIRLSRLVLPGMRERRWGRIINVLNTGAKAPPAEGAPTAVSRAAGLGADQGNRQRGRRRQRAGQCAAGRTDRQQPAPGPARVVRQRRQLRDVPGWNGAGQPDPARPGGARGRVCRCRVFPRVRPGELRHRCRDQRRRRPQPGCLNAPRTGDRHVGSRAPAHRPGGHGARPGGGGHGRVHGPGARTADRRSPRYRGEPDRALLRHRVFRRHRAHLHRRTGGREIRRGADHPARPAAVRRRAGADRHGLAARGHRRRIRGRNGVRSGDARGKPPARTPDPGTAPGTGVLDQADRCSGRRPAARRDGPGDCRAVRLGLGCRLADRRLRARRRLRPAASHRPRHRPAGGAPDRTRRNRGRHPPGAVAPRVESTRVRLVRIRLDATVAVLVLRGDPCGAGRTRTR